jgi:hypothetical protein
VLDADKEGYLRSKSSLIQTSGRASRNVDGRVVLYADQRTDSIEGAIAEMSRRREKQIAYNEEHGITPQTIKKEVRALLEELGEKDQEQEKTGRGKKRGGKPMREVQDPLGPRAFTDRRELLKHVTKLREEMFAARAGDGLREGRTDPGRGVPPREGRSGAAMTPPALVAAAAAHARPRSLRDGQVRAEHVARDAPPAVRARRQISRYIAAVLDRRRDARDLQGHPVPALHVGEVVATLYVDVLELHDDDLRHRPEELFDARAARDLQGVRRQQDRVLRVGRAESPGVPGERGAPPVRGSRIDPRPVEGRQRWGAAATGQQQEGRSERHVRRARGPHDVERRSTSEASHPLVGRARR